MDSVRYRSLVPVTQQGQSPLSSTTITTNSNNNVNTSSSPLSPFATAASGGAHNINYNIHRLSSSPQQQNANHRTVLLPYWAHAAHRTIQLVWLIAVLCRWTFEVSWTWFTTWAFLLHTIFQCAHFLVWIDARALVVCRYLWFPAHATAWIVFIGVNCVFAQTAVGLRYPTPELAVLAHHYLHVGPLLSFLIFSPSLSSGLVFSHQSKQVRLTLLCSPMLMPFIYRCMYSPNEVYQTHYGDLTWIGIAIYSVAVAFIVEVVMHFVAARGDYNSSSVATTSSSAYYSLPTVGSGEGALA